MGHKNKPRILDDDIELMIRIARHGFVDMDYIQLFAYEGRKKETIDRRILQLALHDFLIIERTFIPANHTASFRTGYKIVTLGKRGLQYMEDMGYEAKDNTKAFLSYSPYYMYHQVQVATVCDIIQSKYEDGNSNWYVDEILNEKEAYLEDTSNRPDAILIFIDYRVLFVCTMRNAKRLLIQKIRDNKDRIDFNLLVTGYEDVTQHPLDAIYTLPLHVEETYKLMGQLP